MLQMSGLQDKDIKPPGTNCLGTGSTHWDLTVSQPLRKKVETSGPTDHLKTSKSEMLKKLSCLDRVFKGFWLGFLGMSSDWVREKVDLTSEFSDLQIFIWVFPKIVVPPNHPF